MQKKSQPLRDFCKSPVIGTVIHLFVGFYPDTILPKTSLVGSLDTLSKPRGGEPELSPFVITVIKLPQGLWGHSEVHRLSEQSPNSTSDQLLVPKFSFTEGILGACGTHVLLPERSPRHHGVRVCAGYLSPGECHQPVSVALRGNLTWPCWDMAFSGAHTATPGSSGP